MSAAREKEFVGELGELQRKVEGTPTSKIGRVKAMNHQIPPSFLKSFTSSGCFYGILWVAQCCFARLEGQTCYKSLFAFVALGKFFQSLAVRFEHQCVFFWDT